MDPKSVAPVMGEEIRLTQTVKKGGCAAKLPAGELRKVLSGLSLKPARELTLGAETLDDACLWDLGNGDYLIQTLDFFTPIVDDPEDFGAIAAANSMSDVYAMGGEPRIALTILAFPTVTLPLELLQPLMKGAIDKIQEAGCSLAGGHSIDDETLKLGFSVTGFVKKGSAWTNAGSQADDVLILTKGLGTGTLMTTLKEGDLPSDQAQSALESMKQLNRVHHLLGEARVHAATDITGFGLAGHAMQMAQASRVSFEMNLLAVPVLPGALEFLRDGYLNRAHKTNRDYVTGKVGFETGVPEEWRHLACDAQTSGGLLLSVHPDDAVGLLQRLRTDFPRAEIIGKVTLPREMSVQFKAAPSL